MKAQDEGQRRRRLNEEEKKAPSSCRPMAEAAFTDRERLALLLLLQNTLIHYSLFLFLSLSLSLSHTSFSLSLSLSTAFTRRAPLPPVACVFLKPLHLVCLKKLQLIPLLPLHLSYKLSSYHRINNFVSFYQQCFISNKYLICLSPLTALIHSHKHSASVVCPS